MNQIFERAVERAVFEVVAERDGWSVGSQMTTRNLVTDGKHNVSIRPDILIRDSGGEVALVGDAKWKLPSFESNSATVNWSQLTCIGYWNLPSRISFNGVGFQ